MLAEQQLENKFSAHQSLLYFYLPRDPENIQVHTGV